MEFVGSPAEPGGSTGTDERLRALLEGLDVIVWEVDARTLQFTFVNGRAEEILGYPVRNWLEDPNFWVNTIHPEDRDRTVRACREAIEQGRDHELLYRMIAADGRSIWMRDIVRVEPEIKQWRRVRGVMADVTDQKLAIERLVRSEQQLSEAQAIADLGSWDWDTRSGEVTWSEQIYEIFGLEDPSSFVPTFDSYLELVHPEDRDEVRTVIDRALREQAGFDHRVRIVRPDGEVKTLHARGHVIVDEAGRTTRMVGVCQVTSPTSDDHERFTDPLTLVANRSLFVNRLEHALSRRSVLVAPAAVLALDLDDFAAVNESFGHEAGDALLKAVADRLRGCLRPEDTLARLGDDEFAVLLEDIPEPAAAVVVAERIVSAFEHPFTVAGNLQRVTCAIGICWGGKQAHDVIGNAHVAMSRAKADEHGGRVELFQPEMQAELVDRLRTRADLQKAISEQELVLHYQPIVDLQTGSMIGLEALVRWEHPERGLLPPANFIPLAEESGAIVAIGRWVFAEACRNMARWHRVFPSDPPLKISINVSGRELVETGLYDHVESTLSGLGLPPECVILEVTETALVENLEAAAAQLSRLKELGINIAIDDFGIGYSSLNYLHRLPVDILKIAKPFVDGVSRGPEDSALARAVIRVGEALRLDVLAEGTERDDQLSELRKLGCSMAQGFYFAEPLSPERVEEMIALHRSAKSAVRPG